VYLASGVRLLPLVAICEEITDLVPGARLFPFGYIPIATSIGGNAVCANTVGHVFWANHDGWYEDHLLFHDRNMDEWIELYEYTPTNVERALVRLNIDFEAFLVAMLSDQLTEQLDRLD
jgi:hypothetical protein